MAILVVFDIVAYYLSTDLTPYYGQIEYILLYRIEAARIT
jgi:hypothetical protein